MSLERSTWPLQKCVILSLAITHGCIRVHGECPMNLLVAKQLHGMLVYTKACRQYDPPAITTVLKHSCMVYVSALALSFVPLIPKIPLKTGLVMGVGCIPTQYDGLSSLFLYLIYVPLAVGIPMACVLWSAWNIWRKDLIPQATGRAKHLLIYFARILLVFVLCWLPSTVFMFGFDAQPWVRVAFTDLAYLQGSIAAAFSLFKPDVWEAFRSLFCHECVCFCFGSCRKQSLNKDVDETERDESNHREVEQIQDA